MSFGLDENLISKVNEILGKYSQVREVIIYGSRAKGTFKKSSDIDLTLKGKDIDLSILNKICVEIDDLLFPYTFDISIFDEISNPDFIEHINRVGKVFYAAK